MLVGSADPLRLRAWYAGVFGMPAGDDGLFEYGGLRVLIDRRDVASQNLEPGRLIVTFVVDDIAATEAALIDREVTWAREVESTPFGRIGTIVDPDGNYVQVMQPVREQV